MKLACRQVKTTLVFLLYVVFLSFQCSIVHSVTIEQQRKQFLEAKNALRAGKVTRFKKLTNMLKKYPLYPYLLHDYIRPRIWKVKDKEVMSFLSRYGDLPMANDIRVAWLKVLTRRGHWQTYLDNYTPQNSISLQCYHLQARIKTGNDAYLLEDTRSIWLSGSSQPAECDPAFARLYNSPLMTHELVWKRIRLAMAARQTSLATYLSRRLDADDKNWVAKWVATHHNPSRWTANPKYEDIPIAREILLYGIKRLSTQNIDKAIERWDILKENYSFTEDELKHTDHAIAVNAASKKHKLAIQLLDRVDPTLLDEDLFNRRLRTALRNYDWNTLLKWTTGNLPAENVRLRWLYWRARALEETGDLETARDIFTDLAKERDYYGFIAADKIGRTYNLNHHTLPEDIEEWQEISNLPAVIRARELFMLDMKYSARREWHHSLNDMTSYQMQIAAAVAANWGWHDRVILTLGKAKAFDDLILRFPLPYQETLEKYINDRKLDPAWVFALVRAESIFMADARSPAGALGLMQVMPATGKSTATSMGWKKFYTNHLLEPRKNIQIGTTYLKQMYDTFDNNLILATAAYNAGPTNVKKWLPKNECVSPDVWIEKIPFNETRKYVKRILYFASVYDWRLQKDITHIRERTAMVKPFNKKIVAGLACMDQKITLN